jgi:hypothetical protein
VPQYRWASVELNTGCDVEVEIGSDERINAVFMPKMGFLLCTARVG